MKITYFIGLCNYECFEMLGFNYYQCVVVSGRAGGAVRAGPGAGRRGSKVDLKLSNAVTGGGQYYATAGLCRGRDHRGSVLSPQTAAAQPG